MNKAYQFFLFLILASFLSSCVKEQQYNFSLKDTLAIFMINEKKQSYFCIPVQYIGDYHISDFEFTEGFVSIGDYEIKLNRDDINICIYLNEAADDSGNSKGEFKLIHSEENGLISLSKMDEPISMKQDFVFNMNHYYIFIEKHLNADDIKNIINEYKKGNVASKMYIGYDIVIDNEEQKGNGMLDDFELYDGVSFDPAFFPVNLDFFKEKYFQR